MTQRILALVVAATLAGGCDNLMGNPNATTSGDRSHRADTPRSADNSAVNERDRSGTTVTPLDQQEGSTDLTTTASIRRDILGADDLSVNADNVKVITADGLVTLRGVVKNQAEKDRIRAIAERVAGAGKVQNQLEIDATQ